MVDLKDLESEIFSVMYELQDAVKVLESIDQDLIKNESNKEQLLFFYESVKYYEKMVKRLEILLEAYFAEEAKAELPTSIVYKKIYKKLKQSKKLTPTIPTA